jgi:4-hydroxy-tetrahydrodipicolinate synthase
MDVFTKDDITGVIVPITSTFDQAGDIDTRRFAAEARVMQSAGIECVVVGGSTGEGSALTPEELAELVGVISRDTSIHPIAGVITTSTRDAVRRGQLARDAGARALLVAPPIYVMPDPQALVRFLDDTANASGLPIVFYNHFDADVQALRRVSKIDGVIAIKDANVTKISELLQYENDRVAVAASIDPVPLAGWALGASASITGVSSVVPQIARDIYQAYSQGDAVRARELSDSVGPLSRLLMEPLNFPAPVKFAINLLGRDVGAPRAPYRTLDSAQESSLRLALEHASLI